MPVTWGEYPSTVSLRLKKVASSPNAIVIRNMAVYRAIKDLSMDVMAVAKAPDVNKKTLILPIK